jgi:hypothetical protein
LDGINEHQAGKKL